MKKVLTLAFLIHDAEVCLALKKRGFGAGNWNGYGGKLEAGETIEQAAVREVCEESTVIVQESDLDKVALINFYFKDGMHLEVHTFFIRTWEGTPMETEEMRPSWFTYDAIPFASMWADDQYWLLPALHGERFKGSVWFNQDGKTIERMEWDKVLVV